MPRLKNRFPEGTSRTITARIVSGEHPPDTNLVSGGWVSPSVTWAEYLQTWHENDRPKIRAIRKAIAKAGLVGTHANEFCNYHYFELNTGETIAFTWRAWGDLMAVIVGKQDYTTFYF